MTKLLHWLCTVTCSWVVMMILLIDEQTRSEPIFNGSVWSLLRAACSGVYWNIVFVGKLYLEDFGFNEQMFILKWTWGLR